eukprot:jgi/Galph1/5460/GphlegSOOS_G4071.1
MSKEETLWLPKKRQQRWTSYPIKGQEKILFDATKEVAAILSKAEVKKPLDKVKTSKHKSKKEECELETTLIQQAIDFHHKKLCSRVEEMTCTMSTMFPTASSALEEWRSTCLQVELSLEKCGKGLETCQCLFEDLPKEVRILFRVAAYVTAAQRDAEELASIETEASKVSSLLAFGDTPELDIFQVDSTLRKLAFKREAIVRRSFGCASSALSSTSMENKAVMESLWQRSGGNADLKLLELLRNRIRNCLQLCHSNPNMLVAALRILEKRSLIQLKSSINFYMFGKFAGIADIAAAVIAACIRDAVADLALSFDKDAATSQLASSKSTKSSDSSPTSGGTLSFTPKSAKTDSQGLVEQVLSSADLLIGNLTFVAEEVECRFPPRHRVFYLFVSETYSQVEALLWWIVSKSKELSSYDALAVISWIEEYHEHLPNLVSENQISNFYLNSPLERLSEGYANRARELMKRWIANVVKVDKTSLLEANEEGVLYSNGPTDIFRIVNEQLSIVVEHAKHGNQLLVRNVYDACADCLLEYRKLSVLSLMGIETEDGALERYCAMCNNHRRCASLGSVFLKRANDLLGTNYGEESPGEIQSTNRILMEKTEDEEDKTADVETESTFKLAALPSLFGISAAFCARLVIQVIFLDLSEAANLWPMLFTEDWENGLEPVAESVIETVKDFFQDIEEFIEERNDKQEAALTIAQTIADTYLKETAERFGSGKRLRRLISGFKADKHKQRRRDTEVEQVAEDDASTSEAKKRSAKRLLGKRCIDRIRNDMDAYSNYFKELGKPTEVSKRLVGIDTLADLLECASPTAVSVVYTRLVKYLVQRWDDMQSAEAYLEQGRGAASNILPKPEKLLRAYRPHSIQRLFSHKFEGSRLRECISELKRVWKEYGPSVIGKDDMEDVHEASSFSESEK